ncbi:Trm112 family protein [Orbus mooreae]|uniref:Trm112 family protein n=1 Tax=Orbus mooreae TaxID=3074107 RepID=UPI00370D2FDE
MKEKLLSTLACPKCFAVMNYNQQEQTLTCVADKLVFSIIDGIPVLIEDEAKSLNSTESEVTL